MPTIIPVWAKALIAAVLVALAVTWWNGFIGGVELRGYNRAAGEYAVKLAEAKDAALLRERALTKQKEDSENAAQKREDKLAAIITDRDGVIARLRGTINNLGVRLPSDTLDSCRASVAALSSVFGQCVDRYAELGAIADRHASDVKTLTDAWPR